MISAKEVAATAAKALDEKKGLDLALIEITDISTLADYFLICTATSNTHVKTLCDAVEEALEELPPEGGQIDRFLQNKLRGRAPDEKEKKRLTDALLRRGYGWGDVKAGWSRYGAEVSDDEP